MKQQRSVVRVNARWAAVVLASVLALGAVSLRAAVDGPTTIDPCVRYLESVRPPHNSHSGEEAITPLVPGDASNPQDACGVTRKVSRDGNGVYKWDAPIDGPVGTGPMRYEQMSACWANLIGVGPWLQPHLNSVDFHVRADNWGWNNQQPEWSDGFVFPVGFRMAVSLLGTPGLGTFLSPSPTIGGSSVALVPAGAAGASTWWQGTTRPTLHQSVDLVTGAQLIQQTDLELPFGGATFRLNRTRSGIHANETIPSLSNVGELAGDAPWGTWADGWWDWAGNGWMISENPLLLIDSAVPDVVGPHARTCFLVLDAHHTIPFQQVNLAVGQDGNPRVGYEAPPRFRARMSHNGIWGTIVGPNGSTTELGWQTPPTQYEVWLYDGQVKYTFVAIHEDVPPKRWNKNYAGGDPEWHSTSYHNIASYKSEDPGWEPYESDASPGFGIPYYGLCVKIEDRFGHAAEIDYCEAKRRAIDDNDAETGTPGCIECLDGCIRKGQISSIRLISTRGAAREVEWTLLYVHRHIPYLMSPTFGLDAILDAVPLHPSAWPVSVMNADPTAKEAIVASSGTSVVDHILVMKGNAIPSGATVPPCLEIGSLVGPDAVNPPDPLDVYNASQAPAMRITMPWTYRVQYGYGINLTNSYSEPAPPRSFDFPPNLVRVTTATRDVRDDGQVVDGSTAERHSFIRYSEGLSGATGEGGFSQAFPWVTQVYTPEDYDRMMAWARGTSAPSSTESPCADETILKQWLSNMTPEAFSMSDRRWIDRATPPADVILDTGTTPPGQNVSCLRQMLLTFASLQLTTPYPQSGPTSTEEWPASSSTTCLSEMPAFEWLIQSTGNTLGYVKSVLAGQLALDINQAGEQSVRSCSIRDQRGVTHHYRVHRMVVTPSASGDSFHRFGVPFLSESRNRDSGLSYPTRSLWFHPFYWRTYMPGQVGESALTSAPDLKQPRWIVIVDEFESRKAMMDSNQTYQPTLSIGGRNTIGTKPGQINRRVVEMNAAGFVLSDKLWDFLSGDTSGGGLGESYVYKTIGEVVVAAEGSGGYSSQTSNAVFVAPTGAYAELAAELTLPANPADDPPPDRVLDEEQLHLFFDELILVEHRSVGWSAAESQASPDQAAGDPEHEGLIEFNEYKWFSPPPGVPIADRKSQYPWRSRLQLVGRGVRKGTEGQKLYAQQTVRDSAVPTNVLGEVEFTDAAASSLLPSLPNLSHAYSQSPNFKITRHVVVRDNASPDQILLPPSERRILRVIDVGAPSQQRPSVGTPTWYYPLQMQIYDPDGGQPSWTATGLVPNPEYYISGSGSAVSNDPLQSLIFTYTKFDEGQIKYVVADAVPNPDLTSKTGGFAAPVPAVPLAGWTRLGTTDPLQYVTYYIHDKYGPTDIYFPNGRRFARRLVQIAPRPKNPDGSDGSPTNSYFEPPEHANPDQIGAAPSLEEGWTVLDHDKQPFVREFIFNDLERDDDENSPTHGAVRARSAGEIRDYAGKEPEGQPVLTRRVEYIQLGSSATGIVDAVISPGGTATDDFLSNPSPSNQPFFSKLAEKKLRPNQYGVLTEAELFERSVDGTYASVGFKQVNDLGEIYREREMDGSITRWIRNAIGQNTRKYIGTVDDNWLERTTNDGTLLNFKPGHSTGDDSHNDLVMVERTDYGSSPNDAWMPTITRRYDTNRDDVGSTSATNSPIESSIAAWIRNPFSTPPANDTIGQATKTAYDWRMRPVRTDVFAKGDPATAARLQTSLTYLDHAGRTVMTVTYGADDPAVGTLPSLSAVDPANLGPTDVPPEATAILALSGIRPTSLVEMRYGPDGFMIERREYDVTSTAQAPRYQVEYQFAGVGGQTVFQRRPGSGATITTLDGLGRTSRVATVVPRGSGNATTYDFEVARTDYFYDADNNQKKVIHWERIVGQPNDDAAAAVDPQLSTANAVGSTTVNCHDVQKRLVATVDMGSGYNAGYISSSAAPITFEFDTTTRPEINPTAKTITLAGAPSDVPMTVYRYDRNGNQTHVATRQAAGASSAGEPKWLVTAMEYTGTKKLGRKIENAFAPAAEQRITNYIYRFGKLAGINAENPGAPTQQTLVDFGANPENSFGAQIVDRGSGGNSFEVYSYSGSMARALRMPQNGSNTGNPVQPSTPTYLFRYDYQGRLAERVDARGLSLRYTYDALDRLTSSEVGYYTYGPLGTNPQAHDGYPSSMGLPGRGAPADRIGYVTYAYAPDHRTVDVKAFANSASTTLIAHNRSEFDANGRLVVDWQSHGELIHAAEPTIETPRTAYVWDANYHSSSDVNTGHTRLQSMLYRTPENLTRRFVNFDYGLSDGTDNALGRISQIQTAAVGVAQPTLPIARFGYVGADRRYATTRGNDLLSQSLGLDAVFTGDNTIGLTGLDRWGRLKDLDFRRGAADGGGASLTRVQYSYDVAGNRLGAVRTPVPITTNGSGWTSASTQQQSNQYDTLGRLTSSVTNHIDSTIAQNDLLRSDTWSLDALGNWKSQTFADASTANQPETRVRWHENDNRLSAIGYPGASKSESAQLTYDAAGNLTYDGSYIYQYDAWNRLLQVNRGGVPNQNPDTLRITPSGLYYAMAKTPRTPTAPWRTPLGWVGVGVVGVGYGFGTFSHDDPTPDGPPESVGEGFVTNRSPGDMGLPDDVVAFQLVKHFTYDGRGRLIRTVEPRGASVTLESELRSIRYLYDGVRRVQEMTSDHLPDLYTLGTWPGLTTTDAAAVSAALEHTDFTTLPLSLELRLVRGQITAPSPPSGYTRQPITKALTREYIWGPGDRGLDECLAQIDGQGQIWWPLQDAGLDVIGLCDAGDGGTLFNTTPGTGQGAGARLVGQWTYDAYGRVLTADYPTATGSNPYGALCHPKMGHKGLFHERLDQAGPLSGTDLSNDPAVLVPGATSIVHMRNRWYSPQLGRFVSVDPNSSGAVLLSEQACLGSTGTLAIAVFGLQPIYDDGASLWAYAQHNPISNGDPLGLDVSDEGELTDEDAEHNYDMKDLIEDAFSIVAMLNPIPTPADFISSVTRALTEEYSERLEWDVDWASDWSMPDDAHSRGDNMWVTLAIGRGLYEAYDLRVPFSGDTVNPLSSSMGALGAANGGNTRTTGPDIVSEHHIATSRNSTGGLRWTIKWKKIFKEHKIKGNPFEWAENKVKLKGHMGPHPDTYHGGILDGARTALHGKSAVEAERALRKYFSRVKRSIIKHGAAHFKLNRSGGRSRR